MALTIEDISKATRVDRLVKGARVRSCVLKTSLGAGNATDYSSGFALPLTKLGFTSIWGLLSVSAQNNAGTMLADKVWWTFDHVNNKLRFWTGSTGATNMTEESGSNIDAGAKIRLVVIGV